MDGCFQVILCFSDRQQQLLGSQASAAGATDLMDQLPVPSMQEVLQNMDAQSIRQLQALLCAESADSSFLLLPLKDCPTLVQVSLPHLVRHNKILC